LKPNDLVVYDAYPVMFGGVTRAVAALAQLPLEDMGKALDRIALTGVWRSAACELRPMSAELVAQHRALVDTARTTFGGGG